jgi:small-conductance mechanosensitive channel
MEEQLKAWLFDPALGKLFGSILGIALIYAAVKFLQRSVVRYVEETETRYRGRKFVAFLGYAAGFLLLAGILSDRFRQLTVAFGVAGAGVAFALQEVIAKCCRLGSHIFRGVLSTGRPRAARSHPW